MPESVRIEIEFFKIVAHTWKPWEDEAWDAFAERVETGQTSVRF